MPRASRIRPTTSYIREMVFSIIGPERIRGARFIDLFSGTGIVGLEALSRGAARVTFVDSDYRLSELLEERVREWGVNERAEIVCSDVFKWLKLEAASQSGGAGNVHCDFVYAGPPYYSAKPYKFTDLTSRLMAGIKTADGMFHEESVFMLELPRSQLFARVKPKKSGSERRREIEKLGRLLDEPYQHQFDDPWPEVYRRLGVPLSFPLFDWRTSGKTAVLIFGAKAGLDTREVV